MLTGVENYCWALHIGLIHVDILCFRIHCEFQVNEPPKLPFWVTPAQFTGNLVISKDGLSVKHFNLYLPSDRKLNVDMEWITKLADTATGEGEQMEVEIAYQPKMAIFTVKSHVLWYYCFILGNSNSHLLATANKYLRT